MITSRLMRDYHILPAQLTAAKQLLVAYGMLVIQIAVFYISAGYLGSVYGFSLGLRFSTIRLAPLFSIRCVPSF